ncbi:unnamed protein product [Lactuca virosa]|uniref:Uncharacterized protein n=1 Tax=Lactuca virosa TaxID=75947 RepID=A0AAU9NFL8_9ASTR|nr:unnamed protein product [Lactuca virosa]
MALLPILGTRFEFTPLNLLVYCILIEECLKQHYRRTQDPKQLQQPHTSHAFALSQVMPNNLNGGPVLPSVLYYVVPVGFQGPSGLPVLNHSTRPPMLPGSGPSPTPSAPSSSNSVHGTNLPSASSPLNPAGKEDTGSLERGRYRYNQMLSPRNANQSSLPPGSHSVTDRGVRMLPAGSGMGVMCGMTRGIKMERPPSSSIMNSTTSLLTSSTPTPTPTFVQGNSVLRSHDAMHMIRPNQNTVVAEQASQSQL